MHQLSSNDEVDNTDKSSDREVDNAVKPDAAAQWVQITGLRCVVEVNKPYLSPGDIDLSAPVIVIRSPMGSGKTTAIFAAVIASGRPWLFIAHRTALCRSQAASRGGVYYNDDEGPGGDPLTPFLATTPQGLLSNRVEAWLERYPDGLIIVDEAPAVFAEMLLSSTVDSRVVVCERMAAALSTHTSILTSADLTPEAARRWLLLTGQDGSDVAVLDNLHSAPRGSAAQIPSPGVLQNAALRALRRGQHLFYISPSRGSCNEMAGKAGRKGYRVLVLTGRVEDDAVAQEWMANPTRGYDIVIASPTVEAGVDLRVQPDGKPLFDAIYLDASRCPPCYSVNSIVQMTARARGTRKLFWAGPFVGEEDAEEDAVTSSRGPAEPFYHVELAEWAAAAADRDIAAFTDHAGVRERGFTMRCAVTALASLLKAEQVVESGQRPVLLPARLAAVGWAIAECASEPDSKKERADRAKLRNSGLKRDVTIFHKTENRPAWAKHAEKELAIDREHPGEVLFRMLSNDGRRADTATTRDAWGSAGDVLGADVREWDEASVDREHHTGCYRLYGHLFGLMEIDPLTLLSGQRRAIDPSTYPVLLRCLQDPRWCYMLHRLRVRAPATEKGLIRVLGSLLNRIGVQLTHRQIKARSYFVQASAVARQWVVGAVGLDRGSTHTCCKEDGLPTTSVVREIPAAVFTNLMDGPGVYPTMAAAASLLVLPDAVVAVAEYREAHEQDDDSDENPAHVKSRNDAVAAVLSAATEGAAPLSAENWWREDAGRIHQGTLPSTPKVLRPFITTTDIDTFLVSADIKSAHLAIMADLTQDPTAKAIASADDPYLAAAALILPQYLLDRELDGGRALTKKVWNPLQNGCGVKKLAKIIGDTPALAGDRAHSGHESARLVREAFRAALPGLVAMEDRLFWEIDEAKSAGETLFKVTTLTGKEHYLPISDMDARKATRKVMAAHWSVCEAEAMDHVLTNLPPSMRAAVVLFDGLLCEGRGENRRALAEELRRLVVAACTAAGFTASAKAGYGDTWAEAEAAMPALMIDRAAA